MNLDQKDIFICHASEDKKSVVRPLVKAFDGADISYWYSKHNSCAQEIWGGFNHYIYNWAFRSKDPKGHHLFLV